MHPHKFFGNYFDQSMFDFKDTCGKTIDRVIRINRDRFLKDDRPCIVLVIDQMNGRSGPLYTMRKYGSVDTVSIHSLATEGG